MSVTTLLLVIGSEAIPPDSITARTDEALPVRGAAFSGRIVPTGGEPPYTYALTAGALPPGLTLDTSTGALPGTPTTQGWYEFEVEVTDMLGSVEAMVFALLVAGGFDWKTPQQLPTAEHAVAYSTQFEATGGTSPYTFSIQAGSPQGGLTLSGANAGLYTRASPNAPTVTTRNTFTLRVTDTTGNYVDRMFVEYTLPPLQLLGITQPFEGLVGLPFSSQLLHQYGMVQPYPAIEPQVQWLVTSGSLPPGLSLAPLTGVLSGTPTLAGSYSFTITLSDPIGASIAIPCTLYVHAATDIDRVFTTTFGDGFASTFSIAHNLALGDTFPRSVAIYDVALGYPAPRVEMEWEVVDDNTIEIKASGVPSVGQFLVKITG
jgi:large repetitive protein